MNKIPLNIQRFADGKVVIDTKLDTKNFENGLNKMKNTSSKAGSTIKSIVAGLGITKLISTAMGQISGSVDGAIKRIDTFNAFPKVLKNFGVSAEEANASIKRIDKSVRGLPTSLDQAIGGVQNLFMVTKDLSKAEEMFKAINDSAMVFANGSTEAVDRFIYAYKQALSSGKVSAQDFNQMNEAIPGLMDKVAQSMGINYKELKEGLSDGSVSIEEFNDALKKLDTEGGAGMESLAEVAKSSTGGIATSVANAKTAITRGVADVIESLDKSLKDANLPGISEIITNVGKTTENVLKKISEHMPDIVNNVDKIVPMLGLLSAGFSTIRFDSILGLSDAFSSLGKNSKEKIEESISSLKKLESEAKGKKKINLQNEIKELEAMKNSSKVTVDTMLGNFGKISSVLTKGLGFAALGGLVLVGMGLVQENFGDSINQMLDIAIEKGPEIITKLGEGLVSKLPELMQKGTELLSKLIETINANLPAIITVGMQIISELIIGLAQALPTLTPQIMETVLIIVESLLDNIDMIIDAGIQLIMGLADGLILALPILIEKLPIIIDKLVMGFANNAPKIHEAGIKLILKLAEGLLLALPQLLAIIPPLVSSIFIAFMTYIGKMLEIGKKIIDNIKSGLNSMKTALISAGINLIVSLITNVSKSINGIKNVGKNLVKGIWNGINDAKGWILGKIKGFGQSIVKGIKGIFGIHSPSTVMRDEVGKYLAQGVGVGFEDELDNVYRDMQKSINFENAKIQANVESGKIFNSLVNSTPVEITLDASVDMDSQKVGRLVTPSVARTIKTGGGY